MATDAAAASAAD